MIGTFGGSPNRRLDERDRRETTASAASVVLQGPVATFATTLASTGPQTPPSPQANGAWEMARSLALAGGGSARITIDLASGEPAELRVTVRHGRVTVLAQVGTLAAERAIRAIESTIARSLTEAGLHLQQLRVLHKAPAEGASARRRGRGRREPREDQS